MSWRPTELPDLTGKRVLVTGANSGIGFEAARIFARQGAHVTLGCRDPHKARTALERIAAETPGARVAVLELDLSSLEAVRAAAARFAAEHPQLDVLCNNAGVMAIPRTLSADGFEMQLAVNHFGHFALTGLLLPQLLAAEAARVVTVSSNAHRIGHMHWNDLDGARSYHKWSAYGQSKLANLLFAFELQRKLAARGARAISVACHPGYAATNLQLVGPQIEGSRIAAAIFRMGNALLAQSAEKGAWPTLYAAAVPAVRGGDYIGPGGPGEIAGTPKNVAASRSALDEVAARRLWDISVQRTGVTYG